MEAYRQGMRAGANNATPTAFTPSAPRQRDYINFPDARKANGSKPPPSGKSMRVVA